MARKRDENTTEIDGNTGLPILTALPGGTPASNAPDTDASRKTEELFWHLLGEDKEGTGYVTVHYLENGQNGRETRVLQAPADQYDYQELLSVVQRDYAHALHSGRTGQYRVRLYVHDGRQHVCRGNKLESIVATAKTGTLPVPVTAPGTDPALAAILGQLAQGQQQLATAIADLSRPRESQAMAILKDTAPLWMPALAAGLVEWLKAPKKSDDGLAVLERALTLTGTIKDMREDDDNTPEAPNPWAAVGLKALEGFNTFMTQRAMAVPPPPPSAPGAAPAGMPGHPLYQQVTALVGVAADRADPYETAEQLWKMVPPEHKGPLHQFLDRPEALKELTMIHPGVMDHLEWFTYLRRTILDIADESVQDSGQTHEARPDNDGGPDHGNANS